MRGFLPRAFRRSISDDDMRPYLELVGTALDEGQPFEQAMRAGLKMALCSPRFLFLTERPGKLDDFALASRLSYFLWSSMPDEELLEAARRGGLAQPDVLHGQVERMLKSPRAAAFTENFLGQWLNLRQINFTTPDKQLYPEFDDLLEWSMVRETHLFFEELLRHDLSVLNFVDSDFTMLNERLARHYGIAGVLGLEFRKVALRPEYHRGGVLTQGSVLKVTANGTTTSPVVRGVWVLDRILDKPPKPPPADVPKVEPDIRGATTIREQLAKHREIASCASCHKQIDPPGYALENYDPIGGWRERYRAKARGSPGPGRSWRVRRWRRGDLWRGSGRGGRGHSGGRPQVRRPGRVEKAAARGSGPDCPRPHRKAGGLRDRERAGIRRPRRGRTDRGPDARAEVWPASLVHAVVQSELFLNK